MSAHSGSIPTSRLLPLGWHKAPAIWWQTDPTDAFAFGVLNLFFGTLGLWVPILYAALSSEPVRTTIRELLHSGAAYLFVIPFVASISFSVYEELRRSKESGAKSQHIVYSIALAAVCLIAAILLPRQVGSEASQAVNYVVQILVLLIGTAIGLYIFSLLRLDLLQSIPGDLDNGAKALTQEAKTAYSDSSDFEVK